MKYTALPSAEPRLHDDHSLEENIARHGQRGVRGKNYWIAVLWLSSLACTHVLTRWFILQQVLPRVENVAAVDYNSPLNGDLKFHLDATTPDRSLWGEPDNVYRGDPSPETDAAWESLVRWNPIIVNESDISQIGMPTKGAVKWPVNAPSNGTSPTYAARMDIFHLLHCVNELRKATWFDYYQRNETLNPAYYVHKKHCLDIIRQEIMCTGSMNIYRLIWIEHQKYFWPEFTVHRQCRRWDDILDWHDKHKVPDKDFLGGLDKLEKPEADFAYPMPPQGLHLVEEVDAWEKKWGIDNTTIEE